MKISSPAFKENEYIPQKFTCDEQDISPLLEIEEIPEKAKSLCLIVDDPDAPAKVWVHWVLFNIPVQEKIEENTRHGTQGINDFNKNDYGGPCPPPGTGVHRYFFKLYALDEQLSLKEGASKEQVEKSMKGHILESCELIGLYEKK